MHEDQDVEQVASELMTSIGLLVRRLRQSQSGGELTLPETSVLARLDRGGPTTATALAKLEQISPQSMGATLAALEQRGLVERRRDADDGRRAVISITKSGLKARRNRRDARVQYLARALSADLSRSEIKQLAVVAPLIERLAQGI
jgi:DNA-binding MarR family transcriptional regulator